jgi:hypothetical protein
MNSESVEERRTLAWVIVAAAGVRVAFGIIGGRCIPQMAAGVRSALCRLFAERDEGTASLAGALV